MEISLAPSLRALGLTVHLGVAEFKAHVGPSSATFLDLFHLSVQKLAGQMTITEIAALPHVSSTRAAYKALGVSPAEHRNAAEAMLRRIVKGKGLYEVNCVVDVQNLLSVSSGYSIGTYDCAQLSGRVELRRGADEEHYQGIGKDLLNVEHMPMLYDDLGAFGNPTSDSRRVMVKEGDRDLLSVIYAFDDSCDLAVCLQRFGEMLVSYCGVENLSSRIL